MKPNTSRLAAENVGKKKDMFYHIISILASKFHVGFGEGMLCVYIYIHDSSITAPFSLRSC